MEGFYLLLDVGGTEIKAGMMNQNGTLKKEIQIFPARSGESKELIFRNFAWLIAHMVEELEGEQLLGVGMAFPGPFDYKQGVSLMRGIGKYDSIYGCSIEEEIKTRLRKVKDSAFYFMHDVEAFAIGTSYAKENVADGKLLCLCIGTGAGSAFVDHHKALKEEVSDVPQNGWIYCMPFRDTIIDDYISVRGIAKLSEQILGTSKSGKELFELCKKKDRKALQVYEEFGMMVQEAMVPFLEKFRPDIIVMGGQIAKSFSFFGKALTQYCKHHHVTIRIEEETSIRALEGLYRMAIEYAGKQEG